ncbi:MAG: hypothetical protein ACE5E5_03635 [Phycisphaerae bacterium]
MGRPPRIRSLKDYAKLILAPFLALLVTLTVLWIVFEHKPSWYRPAALEGDDLRLVTSRATQWADEVSDQMVHGQPFELVLVSREVNEFLAALPELFPDEFLNWPQALRLPAVGFEPDAIHIGLLCEMDGWRVIAALALTAKIIDDGRFVRIAATGVYGGSLPLPRSLLGRVFDPSFAALARSVSLKSGDRAERILKELASVDDLFEGVLIRNRFVWPNGKRAFRLETIRMETDRLVLGIAPL